MARACREGEPVIVSAERLHADFPAMPLIEALVGPDRMPRSRWLIAAPITCQGRSVGAYACWANREVEAEDLPLLAALSSALGLWVTHPAAGASRVSRPRHDRLLSDRQVRILRLVANGKTNRAIATQLGYSESTVKLELSRVMDLLKVRDRLAAVHVARNFGLLDALGSPEDAA